MGFFTISDARGSEAETLNYQSANHQTEVNFNPYNAEIFCVESMATKGVFHYEISINILVSFFGFI